MGLGKQFQISVYREIFDSFEQLSSTLLYLLNQTHEPRFSRFFCYSKQCYNSLVAYMCEQIHRTESRQWDCCSRGYVLIHCHIHTHFQNTLPKRELMFQGLVLFYAVLSSETATANLPFPAPISRNLRQYLVQCLAHRTHANVL